jgi:hypothetical protein
MPSERERERQTEQQNNGEAGLLEHMVPFFLEAGSSADYNQTENIWTGFSGISTKKITYKDHLF